MTKTARVQPQTNPANERPRWSNLRRGSGHVGFFPSIDSVHFIIFLHQTLSNVSIRNTLAASPHESRNHDMLPFNATDPTWARPRLHTQDRQTKLGGGQDGRNAFDELRYYEPPTPPNIIPYSLPVHIHRTSTLLWFHSTSSPLLPRPR